MKTLLRAYGFSLAQAAMAAGLMGGLALMGAQMMGQMNKSQKGLEGSTDINELRYAIRNLLNTPNNCRVSLAGDGVLGSPVSPVVFEKENIDEETEGLNVSLYLSDQTGDLRGLKKFNGRDNPGGDDKSDFNTVSIKSMKLIMNNSVGSNYADSIFHSDVGIIRVSVEKKVGKNKTRDYEYDFDVTVGMQTGQTPDSSGETRILSCENYPPSTQGVFVIESQYGYGGFSYDGQSGTDACTAIGKTCLYVQSHHTVLSEVGNQGLDGYRKCAGFYNQTLAGVTNGSDLSNIHTCDALIGYYRTFVESGVIDCFSHFNAFCQ